MKEIDVRIEGKDWTDLLDHVYEHKKSDIKMDGFRKGNVPKDVYIKKVGIETLYPDAIDHALPNLYEKLLRENKDLNIACRPNVDIKEIDGSHLVVTFKIIEKPKVKLGVYKNLGIKKEKVKVTEEEINHELDHLREQFVELKDKEDGEVKKNDEVTIDFEGFKDGVAFQGGKGEDYPLVIGSNSFIPGFEDGIIGMKKGETKDLNLTFPKDYHSEELKGANVVFKVTVKAIKERIYPEYNEEFFKDLAMDGVDSLDKLKETIKGHISAHKEADIEDKYFDECLTKVSDDAKMDVPKEMIDEETLRMYDDFSERLRMQGMNIETYLKMLNMDEAKLRETFLPEATKRVKFRLVIEEVAKEEKIEVSSKELDDYSKDMASKYGMEENEFLEQIGGKDFLKYDLEVRKALEIITK